MYTTVFFFAINDGIHYQAHVKIDFLSHYIPLRLRALAVSLGYFGGSVVIYLWSNQALLRMQSAYLNDDRLAASRSEERRVGKECRYMGEDDSGRKEERVE